MSWAQLVSLSAAEQAALHAESLADAIERTQLEYGLGPYNGLMTNTPLSYFPGAGLTVDLAKIGGKPSIGITAKHGGSNTLVYATTDEARAHAHAILAAADAIDQVAPKPPVAAQVPAPDRVEKK